ncbi:ABC transporter substrate-binding protein [Brevibacillus sp. SIMBA_040]|uniref:ABC transporter substrate-binding protein n=1 Tax=unclassified Brevibacillus TaxID=2684853 RepID=UPI00397BF33C
MLLFEYYQILRKHFSTVAIDQQIPVLLDQLSDVLYSSDRNTRNLLKKMEEYQWISWVSGQGRGNSSKLTFHISEEELAMQIAVQLAEERKVEEAFRLIDKCANNRVKEQFLHWFMYSRGSEKKDAKREMDSLVVLFDETVLTLDPAFMSLSSERHLLQHIFDPLVLFDEQTESIVPHIAHAWEADEAGTSYTFFLRRGIYFHHGRELTAHDVQFTLNRLKQSQPLRSPYYAMYACIKEINTLSDLSLQVFLTEPNFLFLPFLSRVQASIVPEDRYREKISGVDAFPIGTGPFQLVRQEQSFLLKANQSYFKERALVDHVEIRHIVNHHEGPDWFGTGSHFVQYADTRLHGKKTENTIQKEKAPSIWKRAFAGTSYTFLTLNTAIGSRLANKHFRRALFLGMDRLRMLEETRKHGCSPITNCFANHHSGDYPFSYDPAAAKSLLSSLGDQGEPLHLFTYAPLEEDALWLKKHFAEFGIQIDVTVMSLQELLQSHKTLGADMLLSQKALIDNWEVSLIESYIADNSFICQLANNLLAQTIHPRIAKLWQVPNQLTRQKYVEKINEQLIETCSLLFLYEENLHVHYDASVDGISFDSTGCIQYKNVWFRY